MQDFGELFEVIKLANQTFAHSPNPNNFTIFGQVIFEGLSTLEGEAWTK